MTKTFFLVIPYAGGGVLAGKGGAGGLFGGLFGGGKKKSAKPTAAETQSFEEARIQLEQRVAIVEQGLGRCDIRTTRLGTEEVVEIFYKKFNPGELESSN